MAQRLLQSRVSTWRTHIWNALLSCSGHHPPPLRLSQSPNWSPACALSPRSILHPDPTEASPHCSSVYHPPRTSHSNQNKPQAAPSPHSPPDPREPSLVPTTLTQPILSSLTQLCGTSQLAAASGPSRWGLYKMGSGSHCCHAASSAACAEHPAERRRPHRADFTRPCFAFASLGSLHSLLCLFSASPKTQPSRGCCLVHDVPSTQQAPWDSLVTEHYGQLSAQAGPAATGPADVGPTETISTGQDPLGSRQIKTQGAGKTAAGGQSRGVTLGGPGLLTQPLTLHSRTQVDTESLQLEGSPSPGSPL